MQTPFCHRVKRHIVIQFMLLLINILSYDKYMKGYDQYINGYDKYRDRCCSLNLYKRSIEDLYLVVEDCQIVRDRGKRKSTEKFMTNKSYLS